MNKFPARLAPTIAAVAFALVGSGCHSGAARPSAAPTPASANTANASASNPASTGAGARPTATRDSAALNPNEVASTIAGVFGDTASIAPLIDAIPSIGPTWDIDVRSYEGQERVAFYVNLFTQGSRNRFQERLHLGTRYEPMIRAKLRAGGIPEDMTYLAMVESGYDPNAYSSAAAVGMWQFMSSTARDVGLRVDWWVDERRDPARATDAAIRFLRDLQNQFGSLYLAAAAYNGGPGRVSRGLTRFAEEMEGAAGEDRFFALAEHDYLRSETKNYVPQIIAAALVGKESVRYGFAYDTLPEYLYDSVEVAAGTPLKAVAVASHSELAAIRELNPAILQGMVPPTGPMWIRVPQNGPVAATDIAGAIAALPEDERTGYNTIRTTGSESAASVAAKAGITTKQLGLYNPGGLKSTKKGKLVAGQSVRVPTAMTVAAAANVPDPSIERYGSSTVAAAKGGSVHIVKRGESLARIAVRYGTTVSRLKSLNGMRGEKVVAGQAIRVKATTVSSKSTVKSRGAKSGASKSSGAKSGDTKTSASKSSASTKSAGTRKVATRKSIANGKAAGAKSAKSKSGATKSSATTKSGTSGRKVASRTAAAKKVSAK